MAEEGSLLFQVETNEVLTYTNTTISQLMNIFLQDCEDEDEVISKLKVSVHLGSTVIYRQGTVILFT